MEVGAEGEYNYGTVNYTLVLKFGSDVEQIVDEGRGDGERYLMAPGSQQALMYNSAPPLSHVPAQSPLIGNVETEQEVRMPSRNMLQIEGKDKGWGYPNFRKAELNCLS